MRRSLAALLLAIAAPAGSQELPESRQALFCASQGNQPTVYFSAVFAAPGPARPSIGDAFQRFLAQKYAYAGLVFCDARSSPAEAQRVMQAELAAKRAHQRVVETGWTFAP